MANQDSFAAVQPRSEWIARYAARLLQSEPGMQPLDAVRHAVDACTSAQRQSPAGEARHRPMSDDASR